MARQPSGPTGAFPTGMTDSTVPTLQADGLVRRDGAHLRVDSVSFEISRGDIVALLGLNGAGKSTTLAMLAGILIPDAGSVRIDGIDLAEHPLEARRRIGLLPDEPPLFDDMRVDDYLHFCAGLRRVPTHDRPAAIERVIEHCALESVRRDRIATLSRGWRQRVGVAQAIVHAPDLVLLDEPANGLDPEQRERLATTVRHVAADAAVLLSTHLLAEAEAFCNRAIVLHDGRVRHDAAFTGESDSLRVLFQRLVTATGQAA